MKTITNPAVIALVLGISMAARAQTTQPSEPDRDSTAWVLRITCDPSLLPRGTYLPIQFLLEAGMVEEAFNKILKDNQLTGWNVTGVAGAEGFAVLSGVPATDASSEPLAPDRWAGLARTAFGERNVIMVKVTLTSQGTASSKQWSMVAELVRERLQQQLQEMHNIQTEQLEQVLKHSARDTNALDNRLRQLRNNRRDMLSNAEFSDLTSESVIDLAKGVERERQETMLKTEYLNARQEAIRKMIAELAAQAKDPATLDNPVIQAYKMKLDAVQRKLDLAKERHEKGLTAQSEVGDAEVQLASAKAELRSKIQDVIDASGGKRLPALNDELFKISLDLLEAQARKAALDKRAARMRELMSLSDRYEMEVGILIPATEAALAAARKRLLELELRTSSLQPPTVQVYGR